MSKNLTKAGLVEVIAKQTSLPKKVSAEILDDFFRVLNESLSQGTDVKIACFGKFEVRSKKPRRGRNPQTGECIEIAARRIITYKSSPLLRQQINGSD